MKFSCPSCQAKYQIADEKVTGRAMKMKCRKCGAIIPVQEDHTIADADAARLSRLPTPGVSLLPTQGAAALAATPAAMPRTQSPPNPRAVPAPRPMAAPIASLDQKNAPLGAQQMVAAEAPAPILGVAMQNELAGPPSLRRMASRAPVAVSEWHAGIDGKPVGPMTRDEVRDHVRAGSMTGETLVWRDGMTGWVALAQVPDLADLVAAPLEIVSTLAPAPEQIKVSTPHVASATGGLLPSPATAALTHPAPADFVAPAPDLGGGFVSSSMPPRPSMWARARHAHVSKKTAYFGIAAALFGGVALGAAFLGSERVKIIKQIVEVPVQAEAADIPPPPVAAETAPGQEHAVQPGDAAPGGKAVSRPNTGASVTGAAPTSPSGEGLKGLSGLAGLGSSGPQGGPGSSSGAASTGQPLTESQIQSTVAQYQNSVKRACWQSALDTRDRDAPSSARVSVTIAVAGSGTVQSVSSSGDPRGYRGLSSCIERRISAWKFPNSSGATTVKVPFVFAAQ